MAGPPKAHRMAAGHPHRQQSYPSECDEGSERSQNLHRHSG